MKKTIILCLIGVFLASFLVGTVVASQHEAAQPAKKLVKLNLPIRFINTSITSAQPFKAVYLMIKPLATDKPVVHQVLDFYQDNKAYENLFSTKGQSMLCGPASLANAIVYMKYFRDPKFDKIAIKHADKIKTNGDFIPVLFTICKTDRNDGTYTDDLENGARTLVAEGGYALMNIYTQGAWAAEQNKITVISPAILKDLCLKPDKSVVMLFGWYNVAQEQGKSLYKRNGGHYVALAGYDAVNPDVFYVANPLVDYSQVYPLRYSKIELKKLPGNVEAPANMAWYTNDLVGGNFAILESILVVLPTLKFSAPKVAR